MLEIIEAKKDDILKELACDDESTEKILKSSWTAETARLRLISNIKEKASKEFKTLLYNIELAIEEIQEELVVPYGLDKETIRRLRILGYKIEIFNNYINVKTTIKW